MFAGVFQNALKEGNLIESLIQKPTLSLTEVVTGAKFYIKGKESNVEKKA